MYPAISVSAVEIEGQVTLCDRVLIAVGLGDGLAAAALRHSGEARAKTQTHPRAQTHKYVRLHTQRTSQTERQRAAEKEADEEEED